MVKSPCKFLLCWASSSVLQKNLFNLYLMFMKNNSHSAFRVTVSGWFQNWQTSWSCKFLLREWVQAFSRKSFYNRTGSFNIFSYWNALASRLDLTLPNWFTSLRGVYRPDRLSRTLLKNYGFKADFLLKLCSPEC